MGRKSSIPDDILQYKPSTCCRIRNDNGTYRVYKYNAVKLSNGSWSSDWGYLIGKIIPGKGFSPNKRYLKETECKKHVSYSDGITDVAYGQYSLLMFLSKDIWEKLEACFPVETAGQIYAYSLIMCANGFLHIDQIDDFYQESFLSLVFKGYSFKLGYSAIATLLHNLGSRTNPVKAFEQALIDNSSKEIAIDGHVIRSCSLENDLAEPGYKMNLMKAPQVNLLIAYDIRNNIPLMYRTFRGSSVDKKSVVDLLRSRSFSDTKFVVDRGFYSDEAIRLMSENGNRYIIPVPSNNKHFKRIKKSLTYSTGEFVYKSGKKNSARIVYYEEKIDDSTRIIVYKDEDEAASKVYSDYKDRWSIETYNNYLKNDADFRDLKLQDYYADHGFDFIMLVTGLIHSRLNETVKQLNKSNISTFDLLVKAGYMRMVLDGDIWKLRNTRAKDLELLKAIGYEPDTEYNPI